MKYKLTREEKELLLKDLCARLPYHPKINIYNDSWEGCRIGEFDNELWYHHIEAFNCDRIEIKPYLRPLSSMTEEERKGIESILYDWDRIDYYNAHHFDYNNLIEKGLALQAPDRMYEK